MNMWPGRMVRGRMAEWRPAGCRAAHEELWEGTGIWILTDGTLSVDQERKLACIADTAFLSFETTAEVFMQLSSKIEL